MATGTPNYAITPDNGSPAIVSAGDWSRTAPVSYQTIYTGGAAGSRVERIVITAAGATVASVLRLFFKNGSAFSLYNEQLVPSSVVTAGSPSPSSYLEAYDTPNQMPILVPSGWTLVASVNDTQLVTETQINSIAAAQTTGGAAFLNLNGTNVIAGSAAAIAALANPGAGVPYTLTSAPYVMANAAQVTLTSTSNDSATNFSISGYDPTGAFIHETLAGPNNTTVYSVNQYAVVTGVVPAGSLAGTASVGFSTYAGNPVTGTAILTLPSQIILFSGANLSSINFTISGQGASGQALTEVLAGPNAGEVTSANIYRAITSIKSSATVSNNVTVGNPRILGGVSVTAIGADY